MKKSLIVFFLLCTSSVLFGQNAVQNTIENQLKIQNLSGAVWCTVLNDSIKTYAAGFKNSQTYEGINATDHVHVGSITKTILAMGILRLVTLGKLDLDSPVKLYLPHLPLENAWEKHSPVTVRHLLDHTSGLSDLKLWHFFSTTATADTPLKAFYTKNNEVLKVNTKPGSVFSYSNTGYTLLGEVIEAVTAKRYEDYLDENLLKPLGLFNSTFKYTSQTGKNADKSLVMGHFDNGKISPAMPIYLRPAGQFTTTAADMGLFLKFLLNEGKINGEQFVNTDLLHKIGKTDYTVAFKNGLKNGYAFGVQSRDRHHVVGLAHSGNIIGFRAMFYVFPEEKKAFFISFNMDSETADYEIFNKTFIEYLNVKPKQETISQPIAQKNWSGYYTPVITRTQPFELFDVLGSFIRVEYKGNKTVLKPFQKPETILDPVSQNLFRANGRIEPSHAFYEDNDSRIFLTTGFLTLKKTSGFYILITAISFFLGLIGLFILLILGSVAIVNKQLFTNKIAYPFIGLILLLAGGGLIAVQGIVNMGDKSLGAILFYAGSFLLPVLCLAFFIIREKPARFSKAGYVSIILIFQFCILLYVYGLIPFATWK